MSERHITSLHIEKLGHNIEEIRKRALYNILSKLDNGIVFDNELARSIQLLDKLINWFQFEPCIEQQNVLNLIHKIIKLDAGKSLIKYSGSKKILEDLNNIKNKVTPDLHNLIDDISEYIISTEEDFNVVPPLVSDLPLSYRSDQDGSRTELSENITNKSNITRNESELVSYNFENSSVRRTQRQSLASDSKDELIEIYAPPVKSYLSSSSNCSSINLKTSYSSVSFSILQWQPLVMADRQVLKSVEDTLQEPPDMSAILNSCEFFYNVMLEDFPAEIFLQRPTIVLLFYDFLNTCPSTRVLYSILTSFKKLIEKLLSLLEYYSDPSTKNLKLKKFVMKNMVNENNKPLSNNSNNEDDKKKENEVTDETLLQSKQLPIPIFCLDTLYYVLIYISERRISFQDQDSKKKIQAGVNVALQVIDKLIILLNKCIKPSIWNEHKEEYIVEIIKKIHINFTKFGETLEQFRLMVIATEMEYFERMAQLHLLNSICVLLSHLVPITKVDDILPRVLKNTLSSSLLDASFARNFPKPHETLVQYVAEFGGNTDVDSLSKYKEINRVCKSMTSFIKYIRDNSNVSIKDKLILIQNSILSLEFHRILNFELFFNFFTKNSTFFILDEELQKIVETIFLRLLSHDDDEIQKKTYDNCNNFIKRSLGVHCNKNITNNSPGSDILFLITPAIIYEITSYGLTHDCPQVQTNAEDILMHILKCKFIVTEENWKKILNVIMQEFPILQCFANKSTPFGKSIIKMTDPDISSSIFISQLDVVKGNLRFLFSKDISIRKEAVSRLCWLLSLEKDSDKKLPKIKTLDDFSLLDAFQINCTIDLSKLKSNRQFYEVGSLHQVMDLLNIESLEPSLHRSALTQISVITSDHYLHSAFLERDGLEITLNILKNSLYENEYCIYSDCIFPCITILKNICLFSTIVRKELSMNLDLFNCLLRALILNNTNRTMQQDGTLLLCLLLYSDFIMHNVLGSNNKGFSLPHIILQNLKLPFIFNEHWKTSPNTKPSIARILLPDNWSKCTLKMHWNIMWYGGINEVIEFVETSTSFMNQDIKFNTDLHLNKEDLKALKASSPLYCCKKYLFTIQNATTHEDVLYCIRGLHGYILLLLETTNAEYFSYDELLSLPWQKSFSRFLTAPPANNNDEMLLKELLQLLSPLIKIVKMSGKKCWIRDILVDSSRCLYDILKDGVNNENQIVNLELLSLISEYSKIEQHILDMNIFPNEFKPSIEKLNNISWIYVINILTDNLKFNDSGQFYNLSYLDKLLFCMVQLTSISGWCEERHHSVDINKMLTELIECLSELLIAFHHGKGSDASSSFMGLNITRNALLIMNHVLYEMQSFLKKNWEVYWINDKVCNATFLSLYSLWLCRDIIVRSTILQLLAGLAISPRGATIIVEKIYQNGQGIWQNVLSILIDHTEASAVREQAALLLTNLCSHVNVNSNGNVSVPLCHISLISDKVTSANELLFLLLQKNNFFEELNDILLCLHLDCVFEVIPENDLNNDLCKGLLSSQSHNHNSSICNSGAGNADNKLYILTTPSLVKNTAIFVNNLLNIEPDKTTMLLHKYGVIKSYFRCLSTPPLNARDNKTLLLYTNILDMCAVICSLLTKSVIINTNCHSMVLNTRDCLHVLISLLNPELFETHSPYFIYLRNKLWCEIFLLITALLSSENQTDMKENEENIPQSYKIIINLLLENGYDHFIKAIYISLESKLISLQKATLKFIISIFSPDITILNNKNNLKSIITFIDETKTTYNSQQEKIQDTIILPHKESEENLNKHNEILTEKKFSFVNSKGDTLRNSESLKLFKNKNETPKIQSEVISIGTNLCKIIICMYRQHTWEKNKDFKKKALILEAISMLLKVSSEAKMHALKEDLLSDLIKNLKNLHIELSLHTLDSLRKTTDKKILCPILAEVEILIGVLMNFMLYNPSVKKSASEKELADITHKFWIWCTVNRSLHTNTLKMLCTFTVNCEEACHSLILTNPSPGSGPRKTASGISLLHAVINLISKEMDLVSRTRDLTVLILCFNLLKNVCLISECRNIIAKTNLFQSFNRVHPLITKHQRPWEIVEKVLLEFLEIFTFYAEGQTSITKSFEQIELVMSLAASTKSTNKISALRVLRNVTFHQNNRAIFLSSVEFLQLLQNKLTNGTNEEKNIIITIIWSLIANNQRSKIIIKCTGIDTILRDIIKQYEVQGINDNSYQTLLYVHGLLNDG